MFSSIAYAQETASKMAQPSMFEQLMPFAFIFLIFYFLIIRPQSKKTREHGSFLTQLKRGDSVLTSSGMLGTIEGLTDLFVTLEVAEGCRIRILKTAIASPASEEKK